MEKAKISSIQLFCLIVLFELGTSLVVPLGIGAKKDAWLAILLGLAGGLLLLLINILLYRQYPDFLLTGYIRKILGKYLGWPIALFYVIFFIYLAARDLRDVGDLLMSSVYDQTPLFVLNTLMIISISYVLTKGIEVLARTGEFYLFVLLILGVLGNILLLFSGVIDIKNLLPIFEEGWKPIAKTALSQTIIFPFGETICFAMIFPYLIKSNLAGKTGMMAMIFSGILLSWTIALEIAVLGESMIAHSTFPLLTTISKVNLAEFIQRVDIIVVLSLIIADFFKVALFFYAAVIGAADLFKLQKHQNLVLPIGVVILFSSMMIASNFSEHLAEGVLETSSIFYVFVAGIPAVLLIVAKIRNYLASR